MERAGAKARALYATLAISSLATVAVASFTVVLGSMKVPKNALPFLGVERAEVDRFPLAHGVFPSTTTKDR
jgi:hypothetical protein